MKNWIAVLLMVSFLASSGCVHAGDGYGTGVGALGGALVGSLAGPPRNRLENTLIGAVAGGFLGNAIDHDSRHRGVSSDTVSSWGEPKYAERRSPSRRVHVIERPSRHVIVNPYPVYYYDRMPRHRHWRGHRHHHGHGHHRW